VRGAPEQLSLCFSLGNLHFNSIRPSSYASYINKGTEHSETRGSLEESRAVLVGIATVRQERPDKPRYLYCVDVYV